MTLENKAATSFCVTIFSLQFSKGPLLFFVLPLWKPPKPFFSEHNMITVDFYAAIEVFFSLHLVLGDLVLMHRGHKVHGLGGWPNPSETYARQNGYIYIFFFSPKFWGEHIHNLGNHPPRKNWPKTKSSLSMYTSSFSWQTLVTMCWPPLSLGYTGNFPIAVVCLFPGDLSKPPDMMPVLLPSGAKENTAVVHLSPAA